MTRTTADDTASGCSLPHISVVAPAYKCAAFIPDLHRRLTATLEQITPDYEIIFVNDASPENDWALISSIAERDPHVFGISFSRNFGQHFALTAGLDCARGEWVVVMDCDLQDQPEEIGRLYRKAQEGFDIVFGRRVARKDRALKRLASRLFTLVFDYLSNRKSDPTVGNFSICRQVVVEHVRRFREHNRSYPQFMYWLGFKRAYIDVAHAPRAVGKSAYRFVTSLDFAVQSIVAFSDKPLRLSIRLGLLLAAGSFLYAAWLVGRRVVLGVGVEGWTSVMVSIYFLAGLGFANLGVLGLYIGKIFDETKDRPLYVVQERVGAWRQGSPPGPGVPDRRSPMTQLAWRGRG